MIHSETANNIIGTQLRLVGAQTWGGGFYCRRLGVLASAIFAESRLCFMYVKSNQFYDDDDQVKDNDVDDNEKEERRKGE